jgi:hypothetical protein
MENPNPQTPAQPPVESQHFKKWSECLKTIKKLPIPFAEADRQAIAARLSNSPQRQFVAFEFLWWRNSTRASSKYQWLDSTATSLLSSGQPGLTDSALISPSEAGQWVFRELRDVNSAAEWKNYLNTGRHLWLLHNVFRLTKNKAALVEAILALVECVNHVQSSSGSGTPKKPGVSATDSQWIVRLAKSRISAKPELSRSFLEALFAIVATAELSGEVRAENERLRSQLQKTSERLTSESQAKENAEANTTRLQGELTTTKQDLANTADALAEERKHTLRTGGFSGVSRRETITQVLAAVRQGVAHRLESIRQFADRANPNKDEILDLVKEVEKQLASVEERLNQ